MSLDYIELLGLEFFGYHGVLPEENTLGQRFIVDLTMGLDLRTAGKTDELSATINYAEVYGMVKEIVEGEPVKLLECVADIIAGRLFKDLPLLETVKIAIHKPGAPIPGIFKDVAVKIQRARQEY